MTTKSFFKADCLRKGYHKGQAAFFKRKAKINIINGISFSLDAGSGFAVLGESGSGKTVLANILSGLEKPDEGNVYYEDKAIFPLNRKTRLPYFKKVQMVFQDPLSALNSSKRIGKILETPLNNFKMIENAKKRSERIDEILRYVGLNVKYLNKFPHELSGGECQRVNIARALLSEPKVLILDEPVSGLDVSIRAQILNLLSDLKEKLKLTYFLITSDPVVAAHLADTVAIQHRGHFVELGTYEQISNSAIHPYTKVLFSSLNFSLGKSEEIFGDEAFKNSTTDNDYNACDFAYVCPMSVELCHKKYPPLTEVAPLHFITCHLPKRKGGTLVWGEVNSPGTLDPHLGNANVTSRTIKRIFEGLLERDLTVPSDVGIPPIKPAISNSWKISENGLKITFQLRKDVKFHCGEKLDANSVIFSFRRWMDPSFEYFFSKAIKRLDFIGRYIKNIKKVDAYTVDIHLKMINVHFFEMLVEPCGLGQADIVCPKCVEEHGNECFAQQPCGTGPFKFVERIRFNEGIEDEKIVLERNGDYWRELPHLQRVVILPIKEPVGRVMALLDGEIDVAFEIPSDSLARLRKMRYKIAEGLNAHIWYLSLNMKNKYTKDLKVRQAINMAINKKAMAEELLKGVASPASQIAGYGTPGYVPELYQMYPYDPEKAKNVLSEAGYPDGFDLVFWIPTGGSGELEPLNMAEWIQNDLRKVGIRVKLETFEWLSYVDMWAKGMPEEVGINQMSWGMLTDWWFNHPYRNFNTSNIDDQEIVNLLIEAERKQDADERTKIYRRINILDRKRAYHVPIANGRRVSALSPKINGWIHTLDWAEQIRTVWKEK